MSVAARVALAKREILRDVHARKIPGAVRSFVELHDYVDANEYGALCDESTWPAAAIDAHGNVDPQAQEAVLRQSERVQAEVDAWIRSGGLRLAWSR